MSFPAEAPTLGLGYLAGVEIRSSSFVPSGANGSGSPGTTTYHGYLYKKQTSLGLAISEDVTVEQFRDLHLNANVLKLHYLLGAAVLAPSNVVRITSA